ncbi:MAG: hypothetical protein ABIK28_08845 [Planctomycetota bacterium]
MLERSPLPIGAGFRFFSLRFSTPLYIPLLEDALLATMTPTRPCCISVPVLNIFMLHPALFWYFLLKAYDELRLISPVACCSVPLFKCLWISIHRTAAP